MGPCSQRFDLRKVSIERHRTTKRSPLLHEVEGDAAQSAQAVAGVAAYEDRVDTVKATPLDRVLVVGLCGADEHVAHHRDRARVTASRVAPPRLDALGLAQRAVFG